MECSGSAYHSRFYYVAYYEKASTLYLPPLVHVHARVCRPWASYWRLTPSAGPVYLLVSIVMTMGWGEGLPL